MAQWDLHKNPRGGKYPLLLDIQADALMRLATRVVVPLMSAKAYGRPITRLNPTVRVRGTEHVMVFQELAAVPAGALGERVMTLGARRVELEAAIDLMFTGA